MNPLVLPCRALHTKYYRYGNINPLSIAYATRLGLGPTNPGTIIVAQETLLFRWAGFSPALSLLMPTFAFPIAPARLTPHLQRNRNAPLPLFRVHCFGTILDARLLSTHDRSTSELLRTL